MRTLLTTLALSVAVCGTPVAGQTRAALELGDRVRVVDVEGRQATGVVSAVSPEGFVLEKKGIFSDEVRFSFDALESLQLSVGKHHEFFRTALLTTGVVAGGAAILGAIAYEECVSDCFLAPESRIESAAFFGLVIGVAIGVPVGVIAGLVQKYDTWERVVPGSLDGLSPRLSVTPSGSVSFGLRIPVGD